MCDGGLFSAGKVFVGKAALRWLMLLLFLDILHTSRAFNDGGGWKPGLALRTSSSHIFMTAAACTGAHCFPAAQSHIESSRDLETRET